MKLQTHVLSCNLSRRIESCSRSITVLRLKSVGFQRYRRPLIKGIRDDTEIGMRGSHLVVYIPPVSPITAQDLDDNR